MSGMMQFAGLAGVMAIMTLIATSGQKIKNAFTTFRNLWIQDIRMDKLLSSAVYLYCLENMKITGFRAKIYNSCKGFLKNQTKEQLLAFDIFPQSKVVFRRGIRFLSIQPGSWIYDPLTGDFEKSVKLLMPRFFWNSNKFIAKAVAEFNSKHESNCRNGDQRFLITMFHGKNKHAPQITMDEEKRSDHRISGSRRLMKETKMGRAKIVQYNTDEVFLDDLFDKTPFEWYAFPDYVMETVNNIRRWYKNRPWYKQKHIPWRHGILLYGTTGSGKSLLLKCIAQDLDIPLFVFDLSSMNNEEFVNFWSEASSNTPCMILFEDFDAVFDGRKNISTEGDEKITFDCLLNCISGVQTCDGILLGITTNHIEKIDSALGVKKDNEVISSRPGRIDDVLELRDMDDECRTIMTQRILELSGQELNDFVIQTQSMTAAQFIDLCNRTALKNGLQKATV